MYIGYQYDSFSDRLVFKTASTMEELFLAFETLGNEMPLACIYDFAAGDFVEMDIRYKKYKKRFLHHIETFNS